MSGGCNWASSERYNTARLHDGIGDRTPASLRTTWTRDHPARILPPDYPAHLEVRCISTAGTLRLHSRQPILTRVLEGEDIGVEEVAVPDRSR